MRRDVAREGEKVFFLYMYAFEQRGVLRRGFGVRFFFRGGMVY